MRRRRGGLIMAKRGGKRRDPAREKFWRRTIREQQRGGLSVRDFCRPEGLRDWTFPWRRQALARRDHERSAAPSAEPAEVTPSFLPVRVVDLEVVADRTAPPIEIVLPAGPTVRVPFGFDPRTLGHVLAVLEGRP